MNLYNEQSKVFGARVYFPPKQIADAAISQNNPVSTTLYTVLDTTRNVKVISISTNITWAVTQPNPLEVVVTVDGKSIVFAQANPVSTTEYYPYNQAYSAEASQAMLTSTNDVRHLQAMDICSGRSVKVQVRVTWATTQPTPLVCRVKYAKW